MASRTPWWASRATKTYTDQVRLFVSTVRLFSGLLDRSLWLHEGPAVSTDGFTIRLPLSQLLEALDAGLMTEFERRAADMYLDLEETLAHITFDSDGSIRDEFARQYALQAVERANALGVVLDQQAVWRTARTVLIYLERARVLSWWGEVYPGSRARLRELHQRRLGAMRTEPDWVVSAQRALAGVEPATRYDRLFAKSYQRVAMGAFPASGREALRLLRLLALLRLGEGQSSPSRSPSPSQGEDKDPQGEGVPHNIATGLSQLAQDTGTTPQAFSSASSFSSDAMTAEALEGLQAAVSEPDGPLPPSQGVEALQGRLERLQRGAGGRPSPTDRKPTQDVTARVAVKDFRGTVVPLSPEEAALARRLRSRLFRVMSRTAVLMYDRGHRLNVPAYLERAVTRHDGDCFEEERSGRGFDITLLIDMSGSMTPATKLNRCARVARVLRKAFDLPFVRATFRGFRSSERGTVDILRLDPGRLGELTASGLTPLHLAIDVVADEMKASSAHPHLFVLTDGIPNYKLRSDIPIFPETMRRLVRTSVERARSKGVNVSGLFILGKDDDEVEADLPEMFGHPDRWAVLPLDFEEKLLSLVMSSFSQYWRSR